MGLPTFLLQFLLCVQSSKSCPEGSILTEPPPQTLSGLEEGRPQCAPQRTFLYCSQSIEASEMKLDYFKAIQPSYPGIFSFPPSAPHAISSLCTFTAIGIILIVMFNPLFNPISTGLFWLVWHQGGGVCIFSDKENPDQNDNDVTMTSYLLC